MSDMIDNAKYPVKQIAAIHDLSCFGRCALTVVTPTLSAMGNQVVPIPTALLSTHTGGFENMYFSDLTGAMEEIFDHFKCLGISFDAIYSGFLGNADQIDIVLKFADEFSHDNTLIFIDPVMGDDGKLYSTYTKELCLRMKELCERADIITPNLTEACILAGVDYVDTSNMSETEAFGFADLLREKLMSICKGSIIITGIPYRDDMFGTYGYSKDRFEQGYMYSVKRISRSYPGTGDLFASVLLGAILAGDELGEAMKFASDYICKVMEYSARFDTPVRDGVAFEHFMAELVQHTGREYGTKTFCEK